jgi:hypothetical protein
VSVPALSPVTYKVSELYEELTILVEYCHVPPEIESIKVIVEPVHTDVGPDITDGVTLTVTIIEEEQPADKILEMVSSPGDTPRTTPETESTVATPELLTQVPVLIEHDSVVDAPTQILVVPKILPGIGLTVITIVTAGPQPVV